MPLNRTLFNDTGDDFLSHKCDLNLSVNNVSFLSWNIHGNLKLKFDDPNFLYLLLQHDLILLSECWFSKKCNFDLNGYTCFKKARTRKRKAKRDSGGLCVFIKNKLLQFFTFVDWLNEDGLLFKIDKHCTSIDKDTFIIFTYLRPSDSSRNDLLNDKDSFDLLVEKVQELRVDNEIIIFGDLNSRTSTLSDIVVNDFGNFDPFFDLNENSIYISEDDLLKYNIPITRCNEDTKTNDFGHRLVNFCKVSGMIICNGRLENDSTGKFTYLDKKGKSSIDYVLISKGLLHIENVIFVEDISIFSDHTPVVFTLGNINLHVAQSNLSNKNVDDENTNRSFLKWNLDSEPVFTSNMNNVNTTEKLDSIFSTLCLDMDYLTHDVVEKCIIDIKNILVDAAEPFVVKPNYGHNSANSKEKQLHINKKWFDSDCKQKRLEFENAKSLYNHSQNDVDLRLSCEIRNSYRKLCRKKRNIFKCNNADNLLKLSKENSRQFWKKIKKKNKSPQASCNFHSHFKNLYENNVSNVSQNTQDTILSFNDHAMPFLMIFLIQN